MTAQASRPSARFQDQLLLDFHLTAAPTFFGFLLPSPATMWVTPMLLVLLSCYQVANALSYHLAVPPVRLKVSSTTDFIFAIAVASAVVATAIFLHGQLGRDKFKHPQFDFGERVC